MSRSAVALSAVQLHAWARGEGLDGRETSITVSAFWYVTGSCFRVVVPPVASKRPTEFPGASHAPKLEACSYSIRVTPVGLYAALDGGSRLCLPGKLQAGRGHLLCFA